MPHFRKDGRADASQNKVIFKQAQAIVLPHLFWLSLLLLVSSLSIAGQNLDKVEALYHRAERRVLTEDLVGALADFSQVIELTTGLGSSKLTSDVSKAERILVIDPRAALAYTARGIIKTEQRDYDGSLADLESALRISPRAADAWFARGRVWQLKGNWERALSDYNRALQIEPSYVEAYHNRGNLLAERDKPQEALADFNRAIRLNPREAVTYGNRGRVRLTLQDPLGAKVDFARAIELAPIVAWLYLGRGD